MTSGKPELTQVTLNGIDVNAYIRKWEYDMNNDNSTIKIIALWLVRSVEDVLTMDKTLNGKSVKVYRGEVTATETKEFDGEVIKVTPDGALFKVTCADQLYKLTKATINRYFDAATGVESGVYSEIFKTLINEYTPLVADDTSVQDTGTITTIARFPCRNVTIFDRCKAIADAFGWQFYYNSQTEKVYFEPKGFVVQDTVLSVGNNILNQPIWVYDAVALYNEVQLFGGSQEIETTEIGQIGVTAGYNQTYVDLEHIPVSVKVYVDAANPPTTLKTGGVDENTETFDYNVNADLRRIEWNTGTYTPTNNHYVLIAYSYYSPVAVSVRDAASIAQYSEDGITPKRMVLHKKDILTVGDAETYANQYLADHKDPIIKTTVNVTNVSDLQVGQEIRVVDASNGIDDFFTIVRIKKVYPYRFDEVELVSEFVDEDLYDFDINQRIKRLEEESLGDTDVIAVLESVPEELVLTNMFEIENNGTTVLKRHYTYFDFDSLSDGSYSGNIDIYNGDIRFV